MENQVAHRRLSRPASIPITYGHSNLVERALLLFDHVIVAIGTAVDKDPETELADRIELCKQALECFGSNVSVEGFNGLLVNYVRAKNTRFILRGLRTLTDYDLRISDAGNEPASGPGDRVRLAAHVTRMVFSVVDSCA